MPGAPSIGQPPPLVGNGSAPVAFTIDAVNAAGDPLQITEGGIVTTFTYWPSGNVKTETRLGVTLNYADDGQSGTVA